MKYCKECGKKNPGNTFECIDCGCVEFGYVCNNCGFRFDNGEFCPRCGVSILAEKKRCRECGRIFYENACPGCGSGNFEPAPAKETGNRKIKTAAKVTPAGILILIFLICAVFAGNKLLGGNRKNKEADITPSPGRNAVSSTSAPRTASVPEQTADSEWEAHSLPSTIHGWKTVSLGTFSFPVPAYMTFDPSAGEYVYRESKTYSVRLSLQERKEAGLSQQVFDILKTQLLSEMVEQYANGTPVCSDVQELTVAGRSASAGTYSIGSTQVKAAIVFDAVSERSACAILQMMPGLEYSYYTFDFDEMLERASVTKPAAATPLPGAAGGWKGSSYQTPDPIYGMISPGVKDFWDSYEALVDEYIDIWNKYKADPNGSPSMGNKAVLVARLVDFAIKAELYGDPDYYSEAELAYSADVRTRIEEKLANALF